MFDPEFSVGKKVSDHPFARDKNIVGAKILSVLNKKAVEGRWYKFSIEGYGEVYLSENEIE